MSRRRPGLTPPGYVRSPVEGRGVQFQGADVTTRSQVDQFQPDVVGLSISMVSQVEIGREVIGRIRDLDGSRRPAIPVGGMAMDQLEGPWRDLGADLWSANARTALREDR